MSNPTAGWSVQPGGLARRLRTLREESGLTGSALAIKLDWQQSKISKIENGHQIPTEAEVQAYASEVGADAPVIAELLDLRTRALAINREWRRGHTGGHEAIQQSYDERVRSAKVLRNLEVSTIPGLLQTREYAHYQKMQAVLLIDDFGEDEIEPALNLLALRQEVLRDTTKRFEFIVTEAALRLTYCPPDMMIAQLGHLLAFTYPRPHLSLAILPFGVQLQLVPQNRFLALDDQVLVEDFAAETEYRGDRAAVYLRAWELAASQAVTGEEAHRLILNAMRSFD